ncbi:UNVERIFIED_CONTAM: Allantoinase [Sesamum angustifolium]|uniref:Allantoinase n=1 Tax=Sesamum angustifolium TaxID=2727405 RepID=A0AAW2PDQ2_9LAMI
MKSGKLRLFALLPVLASLILLYFDIFPQSYRTRCSLIEYRHYWIASKRIVTPSAVISGAVEVKGGKIKSIVEGDDWRANTWTKQVIDYGEAVIMPGLIDVHAHLDDPGRTEWEGFPSGTRAAAAGGITTLIDMPLNNFPSTVSEETLKLKTKAAQGRIFVDVGFWGGLVPENAFNATSLERLLEAGALGLKSFMCPSGINDFPMTNSSHIKEEAAIKELLTITKDTRAGGSSEGAHLHIVHLADARSSLQLIKEAKSSGDRITVETCPHYLAFSAEEIPDGDTRFKCAPPIRDADNREKLWAALLDGDIDMLSSDHSPSAPELKLFNEGNFLRAWGGISSLQFVLPVTWSYGRKHGISLHQLVSWWSEKPAKLAGQDLKGAIVTGNHADIVVWEPEVEFELDDNHPVFLKHPNISAYMGSKLSGKVLATFVRGNLVYQEGGSMPPLLVVSQYWPHEDGSKDGLAAVGNNALELSAHNPGCELLELL